jgi:hypothetical protein
MRGRGRQSLHFPCFYFSNQFCLLPAFSRFTGTYRVTVQHNEKAIAVVEKDLVLIEK